MNDANVPYLIGVFNDDNQMVDAVTAIKQKGLHVDDVFTPFPIHGIEKVLGLKESRLPTVAFIGGAVGTLAAISMQSYMMTIDWPMNIGGKPNFPLASFVPIIFELTVLFASLSMVGVYFFRNQMLPGIPRSFAHERQTDDHFVIAIKKESKTDNELAEIQKLFDQYGAVESYEKNLDSKYQILDDYKD